MTRRLALGSAAVEAILRPGSGSGQTGERQRSVSSTASPGPDGGPADGGTIGSMAAPHSTRDRILDALHDLPADTTFDDAIERLVFLAKIDAGLTELNEGKGIPHDEVKQRFGL